MAALELGMNKDHEIDVLCLGSLAASWFCFFITGYGLVI
jgi:hypothetical protein